MKSQDPTVLYTQQAIERMDSVFDLYTLEVGAYPSGERGLGPYPFLSVFICVKF